MPGQREILKVIRVSVESLKKRSRRKDVTGWPERSKHFGNCSLRLLEVLEKRLAVEHPDARCCERKNVRIRDDVHVRERREVQIQKARVNATRTASD